MVCPWPKARPGPPAGVQRRLWPLGGARIWFGQKNEVTVGLTAPAIDLNPKVCLEGSKLLSPGPDLSPIPGPWQLPRGYDLQSPVEADRTTCRDPAGPGPQTSPRGPGSRTAGLPGTNGVESPGDQARVWSHCREVLFQRRFSLDPLTGGADGLARVICALSHSPHRRPRPVDRPTAHSGDLLDR